MNRRGSEWSMLCSGKKKPAGPCATVSVLERKTRKTARPRVTLCGRQTRRRCGKGARTALLSPWVGDTRAAGPRPPCCSAYRQGPPPALGLPPQSGATLGWEPPQPLLRAGPWPGPSGRFGAALSLCSGTPHDSFLLQTTLLSGSIVVRVYPKP